jgi:uncharacterized NAD(P)/FAD-binding protein YdhS
VSRKLHTIVIVGGGFSGIVLAVNLLRRAAQKPMRIVLVERAAQAGGPAYAQRDYPYLLNVPAGRMSAESHDPDSFLKFARRRAPGTRATDFVPRSWYGDYLRELLGLAEVQASPRVRLERLRAEVTGIARIGAGAGLRVVLHDGCALRADQVVLALGNPPPAPLPGMEAIARHPRYIHDACRDTARGEIYGDVLLVGTGLTMVDAALAMSRSADRVLAISRRGLLPLLQTDAAFGAAGPLPGALHTVRTPRELLREARRLVRQQQAAGGDWRDVVNLIRELSPAMWQRFNAAQRAQFLRHLRPWWDIHRHRLPPSVGERLGALRESGRLQVNAGRILGAEIDGARLAVTWRPRGAGQPRVLTVDWVVNCTGPDYDLSRSREPLVRAVLREGLLVPDPFGLGAVTGLYGAAIDAAGRESEELFCLGPMLRAMHWEATAVAELRRHAELLAMRLSQGRSAAAEARAGHGGIPSWLHGGHMPEGSVAGPNRHFSRKSAVARLISRRQVV